ncbi:hypothetical protein IEQ34_006442 [Dendrobium chrysotoxum]|uniref:Uncharacterized protein n=1 Tax=Dendrobium chrysotoxum TaxID=161865 RepID=A0AAV7HEZ0_DENCH|nr:hypothetical protein IEQ34_006442 [Dendrobium chrysotoxum]
MAAKKADALKGKIEQFKSKVEEKFSTLEGKFFNHGESDGGRFWRLEEMTTKLIEMQSKTPLEVLMANPNHKLSEIPLAQSKGKEIT